MKKEQQQTKYYEFIRYAMNLDVQSLPDVSGMDWRKLYQFACEQAIAGIAFEGVKRLGEQGLKPPFDLLMEWIATSEQIKGQNRLLNKQCVEVVKEYNNAGFQCCLLKGQGNATMYPNPFSRTPGDIDLWALPQLTMDNGQWTVDNQAGREGLIKYVKEKHPKDLELRYYHIGYEDRGIEVEVHFMPNIMNNPVYHRRLQRWYKKMAGDGRLKEEVELPEGVGAIPVPTVEFNIIFQLAHMMHHFFDEGIGLRQFVDYYFVLHARNEESGNLGIRNSGSGDLGMTLRFLGLRKFAGAVMYVMKEVFALDEKYMIAPVDERRGKTLMEEILKGGNFGQHSGLTKHSTGGKYFAKTWRNMQLVKEYPAEALCEPIFRTWHFFWRLLNG